MEKETSGELSISKNTSDLIIVGAGISGLMASDYLHHHDIRPLILDKSPGVGGRMATRRIGEARFDHGAQEFICKDSVFCEYLASWLEDGLVHKWFNGERDHYVGSQGMTAVPKFLAEKQNIVNKCRVMTADYREDHWIVTCADGREFRSKLLVLSAPVPQSLAVLSNIETELDSRIIKSLREIEYNRCIAVMAVLDQGSRIGRTGWIRFENGSIRWIADNQSKSISSTGSVTIHSTCSYAHEHWEDNTDDIARDLLKIAADIIGAKPLEYQVHRWRYSDVAVHHPDRLVYSSAPGPVLFCGDAFGKASCGVETAALSGLSTAEYSLELLRKYDSLTA
ncbi:MAG: NAD(P)-binding protein [candidate division Zixibacteria bacterium]|nr:NAD(P)-binding protein [candidate division Zixibacteria bacterium]